jgi:GntR family transcriptional repressor for pyruvate dehydrogenase complex
MSKLFSHVKRATVSETIVEQVKDLIIDGQLTAGQKLPSERELAEELRVGRSSVREATSALVAMGVAQVRQGEGVYIRPDFPESVIDKFDWSALMLRGQLDDLVETRLAIEQATVRLAAERASAQTRKELRRLAQLMDVNTEIDAFIEDDLRFHLALAEASQNAVMHSVIHGIQQLMRRSMFKVLQRREMRELALSQHHRIADAIVLGDVTRAVEAMEAHLMKDVRFINELDDA